LNKDDLLGVYLPLVAIIVSAIAMIVFLWDLIVRFILFGIISVGSLLFITFAYFAIAAFFSASARKDVFYFINSEIISPIEKPISTGIIFRLIYLSILSLFLFGGFVFLLDITLAIVGTGNMDNLKALQSFFRLSPLEGYYPCIGRYCEWSP